MKILLFDMDGVLLESLGYHIALKETVCIMAKSLGFGDLTLSADDIAAFEAGGINNEWDEAAICTALLLEEAWKLDPKRTLPENLRAPKGPTLNPQSAPDFNALAQRLSSGDLIEFPPLERAIQHFTETDHFSPLQYQIMCELINGARDPHRSLTHRVFQELVLGSAEFTHIYSLPAMLACESYLLKHDISNLSPAESDRLRDWLSTPGHSASVITSRPSLPLAGVFSTPEAELGAELVGLKDIPIVGWGGVTWLALQRETDQQTYVKPSPVHALTALRVAIGDNQQAALMEAATLVETGEVGPAWRRLNGAQVFIYEDTEDGIKSLQAACKALEKIKVSIRPGFFGIARNPVKRKALMASGAQVYPSFSQALNLSIYS
jgi:hypothetical protein